MGLADVLRMVLWFTLRTVSFGFVLSERRSLIEVFRFLLPIAEIPQVDHLALILNRFELTLLVFLLLFPLFILIPLSNVNLTVGILNFIEQAADNFFDFLDFLAISWPTHIVEPVNFNIFGSRHLQ